MDVLGHIKKKLLKRLTSHASLKTSMFSSATLERGRAASTRAAFITCEQRLSIWSAAILTSFTPSSLLDMEHAKLATWRHKGGMEILDFSIDT